MIGFLIVCMMVNLKFAGSDRFDVFFSVLHLLVEVRMMLVGAIIVRGLMALV